MTDITRTFDLLGFLPYNIHRASEKVSHEFSAIYGSAFNLSRTEWRVLATLGHQGACTATEIIQLVGLHKTKVSRAIASLENRLWLKRTESKADRRRQILAMSKTGKAAYEVLGGHANEYGQQMKSRLGQDDHRELMRLLKILIDT